MQVTMQHVGMRFPATGEVLRDFSLDIASGEFVTLLGPSGCGKSTLLRLVADLAFPTSGTVLLDGEPADRVHGKSCVFQEPRLLPWRTAAANVGLPLELLRTSRAERPAAVDRALRLVGLDNFAGAYPDELSGGMKMRVALARALVTRPRLLLLDEPFGALDEITRQNLNDELLRLWQADRWTVVFVTHNIFEAVFLSQRIIIMRRQPGELEAEVRVPFPYPRSDTLRGTPEFGRLVADLMDHLHRVMA